MNVLHHIIYGIGTLIIALVTLMTIGVLMVGGALYIYSFWGALPHRAVTLWDLERNVSGVCLLFLAVCVIAAYLDAGEKYEEIEEPEEPELLQLPSGIVAPTPYEEI